MPELTAAVRTDPGIDPATGLPAECALSRRRRGTPDARVTGCAGTAVRSRGAGGSRDRTAVGMREGPDRQAEMPSIRAMASSAPYGWR